MNYSDLINGALWAFSGSALIAALLAFHKSLSAVVAGLGGALGSALATLAGALALTHGDSALRFTVAALHFQAQLSALNAVWLLTLGLPGLFISLFAIPLHRHRPLKANGWLMNLLLAAALMAVVSANLGILVLMTEIMALCAMFLTGCAQSGKLWFALGRLGTLLLAVACALLWKQYGTLDITLMSQMMVAQPLSLPIWVAGVIGFGLLAGIIPLHGWVPSAHAQASGPAAALFSAVVLKVGVYGLLTFSLLNVLPLWCGVVVALLGAITAFVGGLYALMEHNINRLLAYHSLENIGIILLGLGVGLIGISVQAPLLVALGLTGGLYHLFNHSLFKTTLFLGAGAVWFSTGQHDIEKLGGLGKRMPLISVAMLVGLMAMAALPPLNGFAGEWVIYQSFFHLGNQPQFIARLLGPLLAVGLAITGALAVMCMAKVYGVTFLGAPRTPAAQNACCVPLMMKLSVAVLALCCVAGGVGAPWLLPLLSHAVPLPLATPGTEVSQPMITLLLIATLLLPLAMMALFKGDRLENRTRGSAWVCGYQHEPEMVITAHGFAHPLKAAFAPVLALRKRLNPVALFPGWHGERTGQVFRRMAFIELAVLLVVVISQGA